MLGTVIRSLFTVVIVFLFAGVLLPGVSSAASLTYYFSENCPVCKDFSPEWQSLKKNLVAGGHTVREASISEEAVLKEETLASQELRGKVRAAIPAVLVEGDPSSRRILLVGLNEVRQLPAVLSGATPVYDPDPTERAAGLLIPITLAAAADAVNPCALFVFTLATTQATLYSGRRRGLFYGLVFCATLYATYFIFGIIGKVALNRIFGGTNWAVLILSASMLFLAGAHFYTVLRPGSKSISELSDSAKYRVIRHSEKVISSGGAVAAGFLCAMVELPCTGGPYALALALVASLPISQASAWLAYYNLVFISPLLLMLAIILVAPDKLEALDEWRGRNRRLLHAAMGFLLAVVGSYGFIAYF